VGGLREIAAPFVVAVPSGARVRTRLRVAAADAAVLRMVGSHLGSLASADLAARCREGQLDARGRARSRRERKRALTAASSSRWAGAVTRASEDQWQLGWRNLGAETATLRSRVKTIGSRLAVPAGTKNGRARGYATRAERFSKQRRLQVLQARLTAAGQRTAAGRVSVARGGRRLLRARANLTAAGMTQAQWRERWEAGRLFLTADGEKDKAWGNETIRFHPDQGWLEIRLPSPLAYLANRPHGRYRLSCPVSFAYRGDEVTAQAASGAVRYDITLNPDTGRWYLDASWTTSTDPVPGLGELRAHPVLAVDVNAGHLAAWALTPDGNPAGPPVTIPLVLAGLPASTRDGRIRGAVTSLIAIARQHGARAVVIENLNFARAREQGRERAGNRPSRGRRGRAFRALISGIPTARFRDRLVQMTFNAGLAVIAVDPAYTSRWGAEHWLAPLEEPDSGPRQRPSRGRGGDRAARPRAPGAATGRRDRQRPADRPPGSCHPSTRHPHAAAEERRHPPGPTAAPPGAQDRAGPAGTPA
jgi:IS605 OrfB family transposase